MDKYLFSRFIENVQRLNETFEQEDLRLLPVLSGKMTQAEFRVLVGISRREGINLGRLADQLGLAAGSVSPLMRSLAKQGLVARKVPGQNRRVVNLYLTETGRKAIRVREESLRKTAHIILEPLPEKEIRQLVSLLETAAQTRQGK